MSDTTCNTPAEIAGLPDLLRAPAKMWLDRLFDSGIAEAEWSTLSEDTKLTLIRLVASSEFAAGVLLREWHWFCSAHKAGTLAAPISRTGLSEFAAETGTASDDVGGIKSRLRQFRSRSLVHILWREISGQDGVWDSLQALSDLANSLVSASMEYADRTLSDRFGQPVNHDGGPVGAVVLAMGKLGGDELNFSSDIDLIFLYTGEGETGGPKKLSAHEYFSRYARLVVALLDEVTADGFVYRVDTRLRPFGDSGPPVVSFAALENYLLQHGRSWERYAYIKARMISLSVSEAVIDELQTNIIDPFVYRRYLDYGVFESLRDMKTLIETEVRKRELANNIKLGPGGIREIEFIVQSLQLVRGGADRELRCRSLRQALLRLGHARGLGTESVSVLKDAYEFLRRFENGVQAIRDQQTHDVPVDPVDRARISLVMGYDDWGSLRSDLQRHRDNVTRQFSQVAFRGDEKPASAKAADFLLSLWTKSATEEEWQVELERAGYEDAGHLARAVAGFAAEPVQRQIGVAAQRRLVRFIPSLLNILKNQKKPGVVGERVLSVITNVVRRSAYVALLNENPPVLERLVDLCAESEYLAAEIARYPILLDELLDPRIYSAQISTASMREDLDERLQQVGEADSERKIEVLAQFQRTNLFRIAVADIAGDLPIMKVSDGLTELAQIVLAEALDVAWSDLSAMHGEPQFETGGAVNKAGFAVIAYGKLGGIELSYGSDLDLVFLHNSRGNEQQTGGARPLDNTLFFGRLVRRLVHFLTAQTGSGALYEVDTRLRPSGHSGLLVVSTDGFEKYQEENAWTWEHQALLRSRPVAGSTEVACEFERIRADTLKNRVKRDSLLKDVLSMRQKMRANLDKSTPDQFDLKQGEGGIGDVEFLVQYLVLRNANREPELFHFTDNIRQLDALHASGVLQADDVLRLQDTYRTYRLCSHRLTLDGKPSLVDVDRFMSEREFVGLIWQREMK